MAKVYKHKKVLESENKIKESISKHLRIILENKERVSGWGNSKQRLTKKFEFKDFEKAMDFVNKVAKISESQNHHPDIEINYNKVTISITDHEAGKVSEKCIKLVKSIDKL